MRHTAAVAASRNTLGYTKGRSASGALASTPLPGHARSFSTSTSASTSSTQRSTSAGPGSGPQPRARAPLSRTASNASALSDKTITPARFSAKKEKRLPLQEAFEVDAVSVEELTSMSMKRFQELFLGDEEEEEAFLRSRE
jgi:hypothetical protein